MKALTLWQPWASLVAMGEKGVETRCWSTKHRGLLAIHAAAQLPPRWLGASRHTEPFRNELADVLRVRRDQVEAAVKLLPRAAVLCTVNLYQIEETAHQREILSERELIFGNYEDGRYAWLLRVHNLFERPIQAKGNRLLWNWDESGQHA